MTDITALFDRTGKQVTRFARDSKGKPFITEQLPCSRCGGEGGSQKWAHTGYTCFDCGGTGKGRIATVKLYTAEKLAKLDATKAKKDAKRAAERAAKAAAQQAEADARRADFMAVYKPLLDRAGQFSARNEFIADVLNKVLQRCEISEKQEAALVAACDRIDAEDARKATASYLGKVGERLRKIDVTVLYVYQFETAFGLKTITTMRDKTGNTIVSKGQYLASKGSELTIDGTVKEHSLYKGEKQTQLQRIKIITEEQAVA